MPSAAELYLVDVLREPRDSRPNQLSNFVEKFLAEAFAAQHELDTAVDRGYDLKIPDGEHGAVLLTLKVFSSSSFRKFSLNRVSSLVSAAVAARRASKAAAAIVAVVLVTGPSDLLNPIEVSRFANELLVGGDGVGYDAVLLGAVGDGVGLVWRAFGSEHSALDPDRALSTFEARDAVREVRPHSRPQASPEPRIEVPSSESKRIMLIGDEWQSGHGGISTVNRELAIALAAEGAEVVVVVPAATEADQTDASSNSVVLVYPPKIPGLSERELLLLRPTLPVAGWMPHAIVGHGRILGPHAVAQRDQFYPSAKRIHIVHTDAEQLESAKEQVGSDSRMVSTGKRRKIENELAQSADHVFGVGPLLTDTIRDELLGSDTAPSVDVLIPGLRSDIDVLDSLMPVRNRVLFVGRADDFHSKGIDILAEAMIQVCDRWGGAGQQAPELIIRGVPDSFASEVKAKLDDITEQRFRYTLRQYSNEETDLQSDLRQARVLVMPSRHEGFGLASWEAIAAGVPVLVTVESGVAQYLQSAGVDTAMTSILPTRDSSTSVAVDAWVKALEWHFLHPQPARDAAVQMRSKLKKVVSWKVAAQAILKQIES